MRKSDEQEFVQELCILTHRALLVAPDEQFVGMVRHFGWDGFKYSKAIRDRSEIAKTFVTLQDQAEIELQTGSEFNDGLYTKKHPSSSSSLGGTIGFGGAGRESRSGSLRRSRTSSNTSLRSSDGFDGTDPECEFAGFVGTNSRRGSFSLGGAPLALPSINSTDSNDTTDMPRRRSSSVSASSRPTSRQASMRRSDSSNALSKAPSLSCSPASPEPFVGFGADFDGSVTAPARLSSALADATLVANSDRISPRPSSATGNPILKPVRVGSARVRKTSKPCPGWPTCTPDEPCKVCGGKGNSYA